MQNHISLLDLTQYGWKIAEGELECDWESAEIIGPGTNCSAVFGKK